MKSLYTYGLIPTIRNSRLHIFAIVDPDKKVENEEKVKLLDDYLHEHPVTFSGLSEFQAVHMGMGFLPKSAKDRNKVSYNLVKLDPEFRIGKLDWNKSFSKSIELSEEEKRKITFEDIKAFIDWINNENDTPKLLQEFDSVDGYIRVIESALKALTDKVVSDYKFNQLVEGIKGSPVKGIISVRTDEDGSPVSEVDKTFSWDGGERDEQLQRAYEEGVTAAQSGRIVDFEKYCPYKGEENADLAEKWKLGYQSVISKKVFSNMYSYNVTQLKRVLTNKQTPTQKFDINKTPLIEFSFSRKGYSFQFGASYALLGKDKWVQQYTDENSVLSTKDLIDELEKLSKTEENLKIIGHNLNNSDKLFSTISIPDPDTRQYSKGNFIGTLADAYKFVRFFHWQTRGTAHIAFQSLYEALVDPTDSLAEKCIYSEKITTFANEVFPKGDPVDYLERLKDYICESGKLLFASRNDGSSYQSLIDDIVNAIDTCLFRIQNPDGSTRRNFSVKK